MGRLRASWGLRPALSCTHAHRDELTSRLCRQHQRQSRQRRRFRACSGARGRCCRGRDLSTFGARLRNSMPTQVESWAHPAGVGARGRAGALRNRRTDAPNAGATTRPWSDSPAPAECPCAAPARRSSIDGCRASFLLPHSAAPLRLSQRPRAAAPRASMPQRQRLRQQVLCRRAQVPPRAAGPRRLLARRRCPRRAEPRLGKRRCHRRHLGSMD